MGFRLLSSQGTESAQPVGRTAIGGLVVLHGLFTRRGMASLPASLLAVVVAHVGLSVILLVVRMVMAIWTRPRR